MNCMSIKMEEKVIRLETEVNHIKDDVSDIKHSVQEIHESNSNIEKALVKLSVIAEQNTNLGPRVEKLELFKSRVVGGYYAIGAFLGFVIMYIKNFK